MEPPLDPLRLVHHGNRPDAALRLFCFPYAGGGSLAFARWPEHLPGLDVCTLELSGRAWLSMRDRVPAPTEMLARTERALRLHLDRPYALFGYSMGALMAFLLARRLQVDGMTLPRALFVAAHRAPQLPRRRPARHELPDPALIAALAELAGTPPEVLGNREMLELYLPGLRADLRFSETYQHQAEPPLACPIVAFGGQADPEVTEPELVAWRAQTRAEFTLKMFAGNHFFLNDQGLPLVADIARTLGRVAAMSAH